VEGSSWTMAWTSFWLCSKRAASREERTLGEIRTSRALRGVRGMRVKVVVVGLHRVGCGLKVAKDKKEARAFIWGVVGGG
jgi:hypothetical protein